MLINHFELFLCHHNSTQTKLSEEQAKKIKRKSQSENCEWTLDPKIISLFFHKLSKHSLSIYSVPGPALVAGGIMNMKIWSLSSCTIKSSR